MFMDIGLWMHCIYEHCLVWTDKRLSGERRINLVSGNMYLIPKQQRHPHLLN